MRCAFIAGQITSRLLCLNHSCKRRRYPLVEFLYEPVEPRAAKSAGSTPMRISLKAWVEEKNPGREPNSGSSKCAKTRKLVPYFISGVCGLSKLNREQSICFSKRFAAQVLTGFQAFPSNNDRLRGQCRQPAGQWL